MYRWIWRRLPGPIGARVVAATLLVAAIVWLLLFAVFPWFEALVPCTGVGIGDVALVVRG